MSHTQSSMSMLPPVRRAPRRDWGKLVARILCVLFALAGLLPVAAGLLVRTSWARNIATRETRAVLAGLGVNARYRAEVQLWPVSVTVRDVRVDATDGGGPFLTSRLVTARPRLFALLAGKVVIDQIEVQSPRLRAVVKDGKLANLAVDLPESKSDKDTKPPVTVVSVSDADLDVDIDGTKVSARELDVDLTVDEDEQGATAFEVAVRALEAHSRFVREIPGKDGAEPTVAYDEDYLCRLDARARIEKKRVLVRRLSAYGALDLDGADGTGVGCTVRPEDKRAVELSLGHFAVGFPKTKGEAPDLSGHVRVRAPLAVVNRIPGAPFVDGAILVDVEMRYSPETPLPDLKGMVEVHNPRVDKFAFSKLVHSDLEVRAGVVTSDRTVVHIAEGVAVLTGVRVEPLAKGIPIKVATLDVSDANFTTLMHDLGVSKRPHVTWDLEQVRVRGFRGTADPLHLDGDLFAGTHNFAVYDAPTDDPGRSRAVGVRDATINGKVAIRPWGLEFHETAVNTGKSQFAGVFVSIGFKEILRVDVPRGHVDLSDISPLGAIPVSGIADVKASVTGGFSDPRVAGDASIENFVLGDIPFGNVQQAHVSLHGLVVTLKDVKAQKGKSPYELTTGRLDFGGAATMQLDGHVRTDALLLRDFFSLFKLEEDPRFLGLAATIAAKADVHVALGGPEDKCGGGYLEVHAATDLKALDLYGEKFDRGHADFEYRWADRDAGLDGADIDVRSLTLEKSVREGRGTSGTVLGALNVRRGGALRGSLVVQGYPLARADLLGKAASQIEGNVSGVARLGGTVSAWEVDANLDTTPVRIAGAPFGSSSIRLGVTQKASTAKPIGRTKCGAPMAAAFDKVAYLKDKSPQGEFVVDGALFDSQVKLQHVVVTRQDAPVITGLVTLDKLDLKPVAKLVTQDAAEGPVFGGELSGDLSLDRMVTNDIQNARARFGPRSLVVTRGEQRAVLRPTKGVIDLAGDRVSLPTLVLDLSSRGGLEGTVKMGGAVNRVSRDAALDISADLAPIDLGVLVGVVPRLTRARGKISGAVHVQGTLAEPQYDGAMIIRNGEFAVRGLPGAISEVSIDLITDENEARITRGFGRFLGGELTLTGRVPIRGGSFGTAEANLEARQLSLTPTEGVHATLDADLELTAAPTTSATGAAALPHVGGTVTVTSAEYTRPVTLDLTGLNAGAKRTVVQTYDPTLDVVTFDVDVFSAQPMRIRNNLVEAQLAIAQQGIHVSGTNQRVGLRGELTTLPGGRFRVFANDFEVQRGSIRFEDPTRIVPHVDLLAVTEYRRYTNTLSTGATGATTGGGASATTGGVSSGGRGGGLWRIQLRAYGDTEDLHVDLTSDPPLSREDIFLLLTIGLTRAEVDQVRAGSVYASAAFEALGTVSGADRAVKTAIPVIDDFRFGSAYSARTGRTEPQVTIGRRVTENVRATVSTGLSEDRQLRSNVEWRLSRPLSVQGSYDNISTVSSGSIGNFGVGLRWRLEFE